MNHDDTELLFRLAAIDSPRPLPDDLRAQLFDVLTGPETALAGAGDRWRETPAGFADRVVAAVTGRRFRLGGLEPTRAMTRAVAVAAAVLLIAGGVALGAVGDDRAPGGEDDVRGIAAPPTTTTTTTAPPADPTTTVAPPAAILGEPAVQVALAPFDSCDALLAEYKQRGLEFAGPYGIEGGTGMATAARPVTADAAAGEGTTAGGRTGSSSAPGFSGTNVQEDGVDEPDIVKTDGSRIFHITRDHSDGRTLLRGLRVTPDGLRLAGVLAFDQARARDMFLTGGRLLVIGDTYRSDAVWATVWVVDAADPAAMRILWSQEVEGGYVSARMIDGVARLVVHTGTKGPRPAAEPRDSSEEEKRRATEENRRAIARSTLDDWVPQTRVVDYRGSRPVVRQGRACQCDQTLHSTDEFSGFGQVTVLTIDPANPSIRETAAVQGGAGIVYASRQSLYVATAEWRRDASDRTLDQTTSLHRFALPRGDAARYVASGEVRGYPLNQFSMSEHDGHFRIATTEFRDRDRSESFVSVFRQDGDRLVQVGQVGGLGHGERIFAVRFLGTTGYVVTFRQVDPLYVVDVADPTRPRVVGELKIAGYSAYLHPMADGYLMGVGQDATEEGRTQGTQVSVFDVRDPSRPTRVQQRSLAGAHSVAEFDHHAFLFWPQTGTTVIPVVQYDEERRQAFSGAVVFRAAPDRLDEQGRLTHDRRPGTEDQRMVMIERTIVIGAGMYTLSNEGVLVNDVESLTEVQWLPY